MKFFHIADVHLGMKPDKGFEWSKKREADIWDTFRDIIAEVRSEKPELLLISGDLFHSAPLVRDLKEVDSLFASIPDTRVMLIAGNHDFIGGASNYTGFEWSRNVTFFKNEYVEKIYFEDIDTTVYGLSFCHRMIKEPLLSGLEAGEEGIKLLMLHGGVKDSLPVDWKALQAAGFDYVACGHIHIPGNISESIRYSGDIEPLDKNDLGPRGYIKGSIEADAYGRNVLDAEFIPVNKASYIRTELEISSETTQMSLLGGIEQEINKNGRSNIYTFILKGRRDPDIEFDTYVLSRAGNIVEISDLTVPDYDYEQLKLENGNNIIGKYIDRICKSDVSDSIKDKALEYGIAALMGK